MLKPNPPTTRELLVEIATEQRKIDIDKACDHVEEPEIGFGRGL